MYRYARTKNRVHRVFVDGGKAFKIEQCNLDDVAFLRLEDLEMEGTHCAYCWAGWVAPTDEEKATQEAEQAAAAEQIPENAKPVSLVTATRRMAIAALAAVAVAGGLGGILLSPDPTTAEEEPTEITELRRSVDDLLVQVRVLSVDVSGHTHEVPPQEPIIIVNPTPEPTLGPPAPVVTPTPVEDPVETAAPTEAAVAVPPRATETTETRTTVVVVPAPQVIVPALQTAPSPTPTSPLPTARPCIHPGEAFGVIDPCRWKHNE